MYYNLKIAIRNLQRNGLYSWINVIGLAVGLTACILIALWVQDELSYDRFHRNAKNLYDITYKSKFGDYWSHTPVPMAVLVRQNFPEVQEACRVAEYFDPEYLQYEHTKFFDLKGRAVDAEFFTVFDFPLLEGDKDHPFTDDASIILSETRAKAFFGNENPIGKTVRTDDSLIFHVTGVIKDAPANSMMRFDYLVPLNALQKTYGGNGNWTRIHDDWGWYRCLTFLLLRDGEDIKSLEEKISQQVTQIRSQDEYFKEGDRYDFVLQPLLKMHLYRADGAPEGMKTVYLLLLIMALILLIACINYVNLVTARATKRSREMAVRKIMGAHKSTLFRQLMRETLVLLVVALAVGSFLIYFLLPVYSEFSGKTLLLDLRTPSVWFVYGLTVVSVLAMAGLYPAFLLSSFRPMDIFRSRLNGKKRGAILRKILVVLQFAISFILIVSTIGITAQIRYMRQKSLGYEQEHIFNMSGSDDDIEEVILPYETGRNELLRHPSIVDVAVATYDRMLFGTSRRGVFWHGKDENINPVFYEIYADNHFLDLMQIPLLQGEPMAAADTLSVWVNETAVRTMGMDNPVGQLFYPNGEKNESFIIKGVIGDFHFRLLNERIAPLLIFYLRPNDPFFHYYIKTTANETPDALAAAEALWKQYNPGVEFRYSFLDEHFEALYKKEIRLGQLLSLFSLIAVFISCIGLFGMVTYTAEAKTKEIGIRKVLGADVRSIVAMLSKEFLLLVGIAMVVALPVTVYALHQLLQQYAYRKSLSWLLFAAGGGVLLLLTLLTVGFKAYRAATANPVHAIQTE
jgi:ABC-type antimicrobial peptide transport system permease subunit